jgi:tRNA threonylcarbamoyladenosine biosynthesis protein TsaE
LIRLYLQHAAATDALARVLARTQPKQAIVYLQGELGAGKSTLARAWLRSLGVAGAIRSPTYTLVEHYALPDGSNALHLDLYRIADAGELEFLALDDTGAGLWLVEWPERGSRFLPRADLRIALAVAGEGREVMIEAGSEAAEDWLAGLSQTVACEPILNPEGRKFLQPTDM